MQGQFEGFRKNKTNLILKWLNVALNEQKQPFYSIVLLIIEQITNAVSEKAAYTGFHLLMFNFLTVIIKFISKISSITAGAESWLFQKKYFSMEFCCDEIEIISKICH